MRQTSYLFSSKMVMEESIHKNFKGIGRIQSYVPKSFTEKFPIKTKRLLNFYTLLGSKEDLYSVIRNFLTWTLEIKYGSKRCF